MPLKPLPDLPQLHKASFTQVIAPDFGFGGGDIGGGGGGFIDSGSGGGGVVSVGSGGLNQCGLFGINCTDIQYGSGPGGVVVSGGAGGPGGATSIGVRSAGVTSGLLGLLPPINWGRIAAFLLGLLLIGVGLFLIKPINQAVAVTIKEGGKRIAETATEAAA